MPSRRKIRGHLHPQVEGTLEGDRLVLQRSGVACWLDTAGVSWRWEEGWYCPEFGLKQRNKVGVIGGNVTLPVQLTYQIHY